MSKQYADTLQNDLPESCREAALWWYDFGFQVAPLDPETKHTRVKWEPWLMQLDSRGHAAIKQEWRETDHVGAIVNSDLFIPDADTPESLAALLMLEKTFNVTPNLVQKTTKGEHHFFRKAPGTYAHAVGFSSKESPEKIDIRTGRTETEGRSVIVLAPSKGKSVLVNEADNIDDLTEVSQDFIDAVFRHNGMQPPRPVEPAAVQESRRVTGTSEAFEILSHIPANIGYSQWCTVLMGVHQKFGGSDEGLYLLDEWSKTAPDAYAGFEEIEYKYRGFGIDRGITWNSVCDMARQCGADLSAIAKKYDAEGNRLPDFQTVIDDVRQWDPETEPGLIASAVKTAAHFSPVERRRIYDEIKRTTKIPLSVLKEMAEEISEGDSAPDDLTLAKNVIGDIGPENIISAESAVWGWNDGGVWMKLDDRTVKQVVQSRIPNQVESVSANLVSSVTDLMKTEIHKPFHEFNTGNPETVNCLNGELTLMDGQWHLLPHNRENYRTTQIPVVYDQNATAPTFARFMADITANDPDGEEKQRALLEVIGYTLMAHCKYERFVILVGSGANGKSVLLKVLEELCGSLNVAGVQPSQFDNKFQRAHLHMKLANIVTEIKEGEVIDDASLKGIVSGEPTTVEHKHKDPFMMRPFSTCWFGTNHMPHTRDFSDALFRRALVVTFNNQFKPEMGNCDPDLKDKLLPELPGILNMALSAYGNAVEHGFTTPASSEAARKDWRLEADQVAQFIEDECQADPFGEEQAADLYRFYINWADDQGIGKKLGMKSFRDRLTRLNFGSRRTKDARYVTGIRIRRSVSAI